MGLNVAVGTITAPTTNGNDSVVTLTDNFDLKAILLVTAGRSAVGMGTEGRMAVGAGTYRGAAVQHAYMHIHNVNASASSVVSGGANVDSILRGNSADNTVEWEADLVSFETIDPSTSHNRFTIDWIDAPATAILVYYIALGGSDITDACVFSYSDDTSDPQDVTVVAGFGQPDLLMIATDRHTTGFGNSAASSTLALGAAGKNFLNGRVSLLRFFDNAANMGLQSFQGPHVSFDAGTSEVERAILSAVANWPTDGFELDKTLTAAVSTSYWGLALKGTFQYSLGTATAPTSGTPPVNVDYAAGFAPSLGLVWSTNLPTDTTYNATHAELGLFGIGATDGTNQRYAAVYEDDGAANSTTRSIFRDSSVVEGYAPAGSGVDPTLDSDADGSFTGNNFRLAYQTTDATAREYNVLVLGAATVAATTSLIYSPRPMIRNI